LFKREISGIPLLNYSKGLPFIIFLTPISIKKASLWYHSQISGCLVNSSQIYGKVYCLLWQMIYLLRNAITLFFITYFWQRIFFSLQLSQTLRYFIC